MQTDAPGVLIVGAGQAGSMAAAALRQKGYAGTILMVGSEPDLPYQRPPLSKEWLRGATSTDNLLLRTPDFYSAQEITVLTGDSVIGIDRSLKRATLASGCELEYETLIFATGSSPIRPPIDGIHLDGVLVLRSAADATLIRSLFEKGRRLAIVGGGYVGLEVAASARACGLAVTVIERADRVLARVASVPLSRWFERLHLEQGVQIGVQKQVIALKGRNQRVEHVFLDDGNAIDCDLVLLAVGAKPNDEIARESGIDCQGGIVVDTSCQTNDSSVYAIGDCSIRKLGDGRLERLESIPNANEQARRAAASICGRPLPAEEVPWFWSDQYHVKLQMAGQCTGMETQVIRGVPDAGKFSVFHLNADNTVSAVESINDAASFMAGKSFIAKKIPLDPERLGDISVPLTSVQFENLTN